METLIDPIAISDSPYTGLKRKVIFLSIKDKTWFGEQKITVEFVVSIFNESDENMNNKGEIVPYIVEMYIDNTTPVDNEGKYVYKNNDPEQGYDVLDDRVTLNPDNPSIWGGEFDFMRANIKTIPSPNILVPAVHRGDLLGVFNR